MFVLFILLSYAKFEIKEKYPPDLYLVGYGVAENTGSDKDLEHAKAGAMRDLASQIQCRIKAEYIENITKISKSQKEYISSKCKLISELQLEGVKFEIQQTRKFVYAWAILNRIEAGKIYRQKIEKLIEKMKEKMEEADYLISAGDKTSALKKLFEMGKIFDRFEEMSLIYLVISGNPPPPAPFPRYQISTKIHELTHKDFKNFEDVITSLAFQIIQQTGNAKIEVFPFEYEDTDFGSEFSHYLQQKLKSTIARLIKSGKRNIYVYGNYWVMRGKMKIIAILYDADKKEIAGSAEVTFPENFLRNIGIDYKPKNFVQAMIDKKYFAPEEIVYGGLKVEFWTNKGTKHLLYKKGEIMKIYVRVNKPCYLQFIYHLANGMRTLLLNNYYIDEDKVNKVVELPYEFECVPPFGVEKLQIFASTEPLPEPDVKTVEIEGVKYKVLKEDLKDFLLTQRGFILKNEEKSAERVLTITTIP